MYEEDDLLQLSALQHLIFCERQCALIHIEGLWAENVLTIEGQHLHQKVDSEDHLESRGDVRIARGVPLRSLRLGISGKADVVEFHRDDSGVPLAGAEGKWVPFPVEYKRGKPKQDHCDVIQLCAQAICLEEMLDAHIPSGALFYGRIRRRFEVAFDSRLRDETASATARLHELIRSGTTPKAVREPKCEKCSLIHLCIPDFVGAKKSAQGYLEEIWKE